MGMQYNATFHNARIKLERYGDLIGWKPEDVAAEPTRAAELALALVHSLLRADAEPRQDEAGIDLGGEGYYDSASYGYGETLKELLRHCEPGAYIHEIDAEDSTGDQWRWVLSADGSIRQVSPIVTWPGFDANDLPVLHKKEPTQ